MEGQHSPDEARPADIQVRMSEETSHGVYANSMMVQHTREEFVLDFAMLVQGSGTVVSRVVTSPGHLKRVIAALQDNLTKYEKIYGPIRTGPEAQHGPHMSPDV